MNAHKVSKDVLKMEQVKNEIFAADSISTLVADFSVTSSSKQILMMVCWAITNIGSRIVNNIWFNEKAKESNGKLHPIVVQTCHAKAQLEYASNMNA